MHAAHAASLVRAAAGAEALRALRRGAANRRTGDTKTSAASSRSHCVFTCVLEVAATEAGVTHMRTSRLHLVDLAGERGSALPMPCMRIGPCSTASSWQ